MENPRTDNPRDTQTTGHQPTETGVVQRTDTTTAAIVEEGLALLKAHGLEKASEFLSAKMVPLHVAKRVLSQPSQRRQTEKEK